MQHSSSFTGHQLDADCELFESALPPELLPDFDGLWNLHPESFPRITIHGREVPIPRWHVGGGLGPAKIAVSISQVGRHFYRRKYRQLRVIDNCGERNGWVVAGRPGGEKGSVLNRGRHWQQAYGADYYFSAQLSMALPVPESLVPILNWRTIEIDSRLNGLLLNWYDGSLGHYIAPRRDSTKDMAPSAPIFTVLLGEIGFGIQS